MSRPPWVVFVLSISTGCGGSDGGNAMSGVLPPAPIIDECGVSELPLIGGGCERVGLPAECWDGWTSGADGSCEPVLPDEPCGGATMPVIGEPTCQVVQGCGTGKWGDIGRDSGATYVDATYAGGDSDGTSAKPFVDLDQAVQQAPFGGQVVIAAGEYVGGVIVTKTLRIEGRCPELVIVQASGFGIGVTGTDVAIRGVTVTGAGVGLQLEGSGTLVEDAIVEDTDQAGVLAQYGGTAILRRVRVSGAMGAGVAVYSSPVVIEECVVQDIQPTPGGDLGVGMVFATQTPGDQPADVHVTRSIIQHTRTSGISVLESIAALDEVVVRDVDTRPLDGSRGMGLDIENDVFSGNPSDVQVRHSLIANVHHAGVLVQGSTALIETTQIRDTGSAVLGFELSAGFGVWAFEDPLNHLPAAVTVRQSLLSGNRHAGVWISGSTGSIEKTWIRDTRSQESTQDWGVGLLATQDRTWVSADVDVLETLVSGNRQAGVLIAASSASLQDVAVENTSAIERGATGGRGIVLQGSVISGVPSTVDVTRALVRGNREAGIFACGTTASLETVVVLDTSANLDDRFGDGIAVGGCDRLPAVVDVSGAWVQGAARAGASFFGASGSFAGAVTEAGVAVDLESGAAPTLAPDNAYVGNQTDDVITNGGIEPLPALPVVSQ